MTSEARMTIFVNPFFCALLQRDNKSIEVNLLAIETLEFS